MGIPREENEECNVIMITSQINVNRHTGNSGNTNINAIISSGMCWDVPIDQRKAVKKTNPGQQMPINFTNQFLLTLDERFIILIIFINHFMTIDSIGSINGNHWLARLIFLVNVEYRHYDAGTRVQRLSVLPPTCEANPLFMFFRREKVGGKVMLAVV